MLLISFNTICLYTISIAINIIQYHFSVHDIDCYQYHSMPFGHNRCHNFIDTPSGTCQCNKGIEDTSHLLLSCPSYAVQRVTLVTSVKEILLKVNLIHLKDHSNLYLYGDPSINYSDNKNIILATIKYIKDTQRFST